MKITAEQIPPKVVEAMRNEFVRCEGVMWAELCAAALNAWPGMRKLPASVQWQVAFGYEIILPLPTEARDD